MKYGAGVAGALLLSVASYGISTAEATVLTWTDRNGSGSIQKTDTLTHVTTSVTNTPGLPDSLVFDSNGNIIYTINPGGALAIFNGSTNTTFPFGSGLQDVTLAPGG